MDRDANDTFDLLDEIEKELGIATCPVNWPIGSGKKFRGVYDRNTKKVLIFSDTQKGTKEGVIEEIGIDEPRLSEVVDPEQKEQLLEEIELLDGASADFDQEQVDKGNLTPGVFRFCPDQFRCGNIFGAFFEDDYIPSSQTVRTPGRSIPCPTIFLPLCLRSRPI